MHVRPLRESDYPILREWAARSGFCFPDPSEPLELIEVVVDDQDRPLAACGVKKLLEAYLWMGDIERPLARVHAIRLLGDSMGIKLKAKGYSAVEAFLPASIAKRFARRLERTFGWTRNLESWTKRL
jgi:hypothetical protein